MSEKPLTISQIYAKGKEILEKRGVKWLPPPDGNIGVASAEANRQYLDSLFFKTRYFDPVDVDTSSTIFGVKLKVPVFCSAISKVDWMAETDIADIARGVGNAGSLIMLGIGGSQELQSAIDTGAPVVKIVKPYRKTELIYEKVHDAESRGCVAVGMDIDHFYGVLLGDRVARTELFGPQSTAELKQLISQAKLPFIIKGVLSVDDAEKAAQLGASSVIVSNHGRGALDFSVPSMIALPEVVSSVGDRMAVLVDSGFKTGNDVFKAVAFGAKAVGFASSMLLAVAAGGSDGVELLVNQIAAELQRTMTATGCSNLSAIDRSIIVQVPAWNKD
jgi:isopentenyl diphosphate isomerase/L-lactate dehydrogenase-like FMN-dependent dehydrogenase